MAIYHCSVKNISRSGGKSAVASASYRAGEKLEDRETGLTHDYTNKSEVAYSEIFLCENAPSEYQDRENLWNAVEQAESFSKELERTQSELMNTKKKYSLALSNLEKLNSQLEQARQSANSSQVQELVSIVQQQKKKIAEQAELIEKLNESDLIVKENDRLKKLNSDLQKSEQNARQEAMTEVSAVKEECAKRERIAESKAQEADKLKSHLEAVEADLSGQIDKKALNLVESKLNALQGVYEAKQRSHKTAAIRIQRSKLLIRTESSLFFILRHPVSSASKDTRTCF